MPRMDEADIEDLRGSATKKVPLPPGVPIPLGVPEDQYPDQSTKGDFLEPEGDIGYEMQPARGHGRVEKNLKRWRIY